MTDEAERAYRRAKIDKGWMSVARLADIKVVPRVHRDDGHLTEWSRNMPKKPPPVTAPEVKEMIADAAAELERKFRDLLAEQARDSQAFVASKIAAYHEGKEMRPVTMEVLAGL